MQAPMINSTNRNQNVKFGSVMVPNSYKKTIKQICPGLKGTSSYLSETVHTFKNVLPDFEKLELARILIKQESTLYKHFLTTGDLEDLNEALISKQQGAFYNTFVNKINDCQIINEHIIEEAANKLAELKRSLIK